jgi:broad specificity phosphatase PhoE
MRLLRVLATAALIGLVVGVSPVIAGDQVIFLVRHAERAATPSQPATKTMMSDDPPLSPAGQTRAAKLAALLASAGIKEIFTTEFRRTRETAAPLAAQLKVTPIMSAAKDPAPLIEKLRQSTDNLLIVGHSNTLPDLLKALGVRDKIAIADGEYDNLFIVVRPATGEPTLIRLHY